MALKTLQRWDRLLRDESGIALIMALGIMLVLTISLTTVITLTAAGSRDSHRVNAGQKATALAEAGLGNALAVLNQYYPCTDCYPGDSTLLTARTSNLSSGSVDWSGVLDVAPIGAGWSHEWRITSRGNVANPTGPNSAPVRRTVKAVVPIIIPALAEIGDNNPLNFIYSKQDLTFLQSVTVASPVYATRDLHLENSSTISEFIGNDPTSPNRGAVGGIVYTQQTANMIGHVNCGGASEPNCVAGDPTYSLGEFYIVGGCNTKKYDNNGTTRSPCAYGDGSPIDQIWAVTHAEAIPVGFLEYIPALTCCAPYPDSASLAPAATPPAFSNMGRLYQTADLGPRSACTTGSVPFTFDGAGGLDNLINNSATPTGTAARNLTPSGGGPAASWSYTCKSARGELSWNNVTKKLVVQGTIFIDGSATIDSPPSAKATVSGQGALILTGTFAMKNSLICVKTVGSGMGTKCDTAADAWDPDLSAFIVVADGDGGYDTTQNQGNTVASGNGIVLKTSKFQGGMIANKDIDVDTTSEMQGPMLSVYNDVTAGQSNVLTFPPLQFAPSGGDSAIGPPPMAQLLPPRQFSGG